MEIFSASLYVEQSCCHRCSVGSISSIEDDNSFDRLEVGEQPVVALSISSNRFEVIIKLLFLDPGMFIACDDSFIHSFIICAS